jgi:hypothetical protein
MELWDSRLEDTLCKPKSHTQRCLSSPERPDLQSQIAPNRPIKLSQIAPDGRPIQKAHETLVYLDPVDTGSRFPKWSHASQTCPAVMSKEADAAHVDSLFDLDD